MGKITTFSANKHLRIDLQDYLAEKDGSESGHFSAGFVAGGRGRPPLRTHKTIVGNFLNVLPLPKKTVQSPALKKGGDASLFSMSVKALDRPYFCALRKNNNFFGN